MTYTIKPLVWTRIPPLKDYSPDIYFVKTLVGQLSVKRNGVFFTWRWEHGDSCHREDCDSIDDGKAKAESYYRERLLAALEPVPDGATVVSVHFQPEPDRDRPPNCQRP